MTILTSWINKHQAKIDSADSVDEKAQILVESFLIGAFQADTRSDWNFGFKAKQILRGLKAIGVEIVDSEEYSKLQEEVKNLRESVWRMDTELNHGSNR